MRDLTHEETISMRRAMAARCALVLEKGDYLLDGEYFCDAGDWQPDFNAEHAVMVCSALFVVGSVDMMPCAPEFEKMFRFWGATGYGDKDFVRSGWQDTLAFAVYEAAAEIMERQGWKPEAVDGTGTGV